MESKLKVYKPVTPGQRGLILINRSHLWKGPPLKALVKGCGRTGGRNSQGRVTAPRRGSAAHRQVLRDVDFKRRNNGSVGTVERIEYDPGRTSFIALVTWETGQKTYVLATKNMKAGDVIKTGEHIDFKPGDATRLANIPTGKPIHNIELKIGKGGQIAKAAGAYATVLGKEGNNAIVRLKSGETRYIHLDCYATMGEVSNSDHSNQNFGKAGRQRWKGIRPRVRAVARNPVDHPMGGGEGRSSGGRHPCSRNGQPAKGFRTRNNKRTDNMIISRRKK